tara:strand:+ start:15667 stop:16782 length:1116 start_codon:yes stop_codon:yes gene_type:complete
MRVLYDNQIFDSQIYGGISKYFCETIRKLLDLHNLYHFEIGILNSKNAYLIDMGLFKPNLLSRLLNNHYVKRVLDKLGMTAKWLNQKYTLYLVKYGGFDLVHPTYYHFDPLLYKQTPYILTVHDMIHELYPEYFEEDTVILENKKKSIEGASHIISVSHATKNDLVKVLGIDESKISVIHHSFDFPEYRSQKKWLNLPEDFFLFVGKRRNYKNFNFFLESSADLFKKTPLVVVGSPFTGEEDEIIQKNGIGDYVFQVSADDAELASLYSKAYYFVFPSLAEGFGIPILEAYHSNCPVIVSDISVFREVADEAALYFDPKSKESIFSVMNEAITNPSLRKNLVVKGMERLEFFKNQDYIGMMQKAYKKTVDN